MKTLIYFFFLFPIFSFSQFTSIPDTIFESYLVSVGLDGLMDGVVEDAAIDTVVTLDVTGLSIVDLTGIEGFSALRDLYCSFNELIFLNLTSNANLYEVNCGNNPLTSLDVRNGNNQGLLYFTSMNSPSLSCVDVNDTVFANNNWSKDTWTTFSENCNVSTDNNYFPVAKKRLLSVVDIFGRKVSPKPNTTLFYIYSDGSVEKRIVYVN